MGNATASVKGGFWEYNAVPSLTGVATTNAQKRRAAQALATKGSMGLREIMETLDGVVAGSTAAKTLTRIASSDELGGVRAVETETLVNRATTAADVTEINSDILSLTSKTTFGSSPVANGDGNPLGFR